MMWGNYGTAGWGWIFGLLIGLGAAILVVVLVRAFSTPRSVSAQPAAQVDAAPSPKRILDDRYAKGELTTEEYRERLATLGLTS